MSSLSAFRLLLSSLQQPPSHTQLSSVLLSSIATAQERSDPLPASRHQPALCSRSNCCAAALICPASVQSTKPPASSRQAAPGMFVASFDRPVRRPASTDTPRESHTQTSKRTRRERAPAVVSPSVIDSLASRLVLPPQTTNLFIPSIHPSPSFPPRRLLSLSLAHLHTRTQKPSCWSYRDTPLSPFEALPPPSRAT